MDYFNKSQPEIFNLEVDANVKNNFLVMSRWTKFLAIIGFVMLGLDLALGIFLAAIIPSLADSLGGQQAQVIASLGMAAPIFVIVFFVFFTGIFFYPTYALLRYSNSIKKAILTDDKEQFNRAIRYLKWMFQYIGILTIILLSLYGLNIALVVIGNFGK